MRIQGRRLHPSTLTERRILKALGTDELRVPRRLNPFAVARLVKKLAYGTGGNLPELRSMLAKGKAMPVAPDMPPVPALPDSSSEPRHEARAA
jgi:hypothetical protein